MKTRKKIQIVILISAIIIVFDQLTKIIAKHYLYSRPGYHFFGDTFRLQFAMNDGAFLSLGSSWPEPVRFWVLTILPIGILIITMLYLLKSPKLSHLSVIAFALILGGGISNMWDRVFNHGFVIDFMNVGIGWLRTGIFNVADMAIMAGFFMLIFLIYFKKETV